METNRGHTVEIHEEVVPDGDKITTRKLYCGELACGLSDSGSNGDGGSDRSASIRKLLIAVGLCILFMSIEVVGGIEANSLAILTDAAHLLSDVAAFAISLFSLWAAGWEATPSQTYGFFRIEILGALLSIQIIWLLAGILVYEAILRLIHNTGQVNGFLMFLIAAFGLVVNIGMAILLGHDHGHSHGHGHGHGHGHSHSHDHGHTHSHGHSHTDPLVVKKEKKKKRNINVQGAYLHVLGDSIQSVGVMIGGAIIWWKPEWKIIDVICTLIFSVIVLGTTVKMIKDILGVLMESAPREIDATKLNAGLLEIEDVVAVHELHIWAITVGKTLLSCHVIIAPHADSDTMLDKVIQYIKTEYNISHVTIQIEHTS